MLRLSGFASVEATETLNPKTLNPKTLNPSVHPLGGCSAIVGSQLLRYQQGLGFSVQDIQVRV